MKRQASFSAAICAGLIFLTCGQLAFADSLYNITRIQGPPIVAPGPAVAAVLDFARHGGIFSKNVCKCMARPRKMFYEHLDPDTEYVVAELRHKNQPLIFHETPHRDVVAREFVIQAKFDRFTHRNNVRLLVRWDREDRHADVDDRAMITLMVPPQLRSAMEIRAPLEVPKHQPDALFH